MSTPLDPSLSHELTEFRLCPIIPPEDPRVNNVLFKLTKDLDRFHVLL